MGVPGDMNLELLDYIKQVPGLRWGEFAFTPLFFNCLHV